MLARMSPIRKWDSTVDGRNPAPPKKPWNDESPVNTNQQWFRMFFSGAGFRPSTVCFEEEEQTGRSDAIKNSA